MLRDDIADRARNGDVDGVLKIFDDLEADRRRVREVNDAYLAEIRRLAGGKPDIKAPAVKSDPLEACARALAEATAARRGMTATLGAL